MHSDNAKNPRLSLMTGIAVLLFIACTTQWIMAADGDKSWLLINARMWLAGKKLYGDIFQPNLPLITWLYAVPEFLSTRTGATPAHLLILLTFCLCLLSVHLCHDLIKLHPHFSGNARMALNHSLFLLCILVFFASPKFFGDRDHLIVVLMLPLFLRSMPSLLGKIIPFPLLVSIGAMAALGVCIKPHALVLLAGVMTLRCLRERFWSVLTSVESISILCVFTAYLLLMWQFTPDYFTVVLPMLLITYSANTKGVAVVQHYVTSGFMLAVTLADFRLRYDSPYRRDIFYFLGLCAFCLLYVLTNNGWLYTFYPLYSILLLLTAWVWKEFRWLYSQNKSSGQFYSGGMACFLNLSVNTLVVLLACFGFVYSAYHASPSPRAPVYNEMSHMITDSHAKSFGTLSASFAFWPDAVDKTGVLMGTRFNHLWMLPKFLSSDEVFAKKNAWILQSVASAYAEDLNHNKPEILFVDAGEDFSRTGQKLDLVKYFSVFPAFADAWKHYALARTIDHCNAASIKDMADRQVWCRHDVYERKPPS